MSTPCSEKNRLSSRNQGYESSNQWSYRVVNSQGRERLLDRDTAGLTCCFACVNALCSSTWWSGR